jgi:hypothetical protein
VVTSSRSKNPPKRFPLRIACQSLNLWMANGVQFFTNIGWAFLILSLPDYLKKVMHLNDGMTGWVTTGGAHHRHRGAADRRIDDGLRSHAAWQTHGPHAADVRDEIRSRRLLCAGDVDRFALGHGDRLWARGLLCRHRPAGDVDDLMQDISGKHQAQLFGWGNMWGNFGAAILPMMFTAVLKSFDTNTTSTRACGSAPWPLCWRVSSRCS